MSHSVSQADDHDSDGHDWRLACPHTATHAADDLDSAAAPLTTETLNSFGRGNNLFHCFSPLDVGSRGFYVRGTE